jgi:hypothetical protein
MRPCTSEARQPRVSDRPAGAAVAWATHCWQPGTTSRPRASLQCRSRATLLAPAPSPAPNPGTHLADEDSLIVLPLAALAAAALATLAATALAAAAAAFGIAAVLWRRPPLAPQALRDRAERRPKGHARWWAAPAARGPAASRLTAAGPRRCGASPCCVHARQPLQR